MLTFSSSFKDRLYDILEKEDEFVRIYVQGGGCSGLQYMFSIDTKQGIDDFVFEPALGKRVVVDSLSLPYLEGSSVDYVSGLEGSFFKIENPNAVTTCGCGSSFSV